MGLFADQTLAERTKSTRTLTSHQSQTKAKPNQTNQTHITTNHHQPPNQPTNQAITDTVRQDTQHSQKRSIDASYHKTRQQSNAAPSQSLRHKPPSRHTNICPTVLTEHHLRRHDCGRGMWDEFLFDGCMSGCGHSQTFTQSSSFLPHGTRAAFDVCTCVLLFA